MCSHALTSGTHATTLVAAVVVATTSHPAFTTLALASTVAAILTTPVATISPWAVALTSSITASGPWLATIVSWWSTGVLATILGLLLSVLRSWTSWSSSLTTRSALVVTTALTTVVTLARACGSLALGTWTTLASTILTTTSASVVAVATWSAAASAVLTVAVVLTLAVLLDLALIDWGLVADIGGVELLLAEEDLEHGDDTSELEVVKTLLEWLVLVHDGDVVDLVDLMETLDAVLDQLSQLDGSLNSVGHALNDDVVGGWSGLLDGSISSGGGGSVEQLVGSLEVAANANATLHSNFIGWELLLWLLDSLVLVCHSVVKNYSRLRKV